MVYKNGIPYDISYQVTDKDCPEIPNTIDLINTYEPGIKTRIDNTWLPLFKAVNGEIRIGLLSEYPNTEMWGAVGEIFLESTDIPITIYGSFGIAEQIYIYNQAQWGIMTNNGRYPYNGNQARVFIRDDQAIGEVGNDTTPNQTKDLYVAWAPNATVNIGAVSPWNEVCKNIVVCAKNIQMWSGDNVLTESQTLYHNDDIVFSWDTDLNYKGTLVPFAKAETEWLENYFNIKQDGQTLEWYEDTFSNEYGKYVRLKKNNVNLAELMYWKDGEIEEEIGKNLTDNAVTKTGSITLGDLTKTYSVTQKPIERTIKARMYFNPVEQDGKMFNNFCIWPFDWQFGVAEAGVSSRLNCIERIRYKAVGDTTWTNMNLPTAAELKTKSTNIAGHDNENILVLYTLEINAAGYYDVEWTYYPEELWNLGRGGSNECARIIFTDRKYYYNTIDHYYEYKEHEDMDLDTPFIASIDVGQQYITRSAGVVGDGQNIYIRDWDANPRMETLSLGPSSRATTATNSVGGMITRGLKYLVYNNLYRGEGHYDWVGCENWDNVFSNEGILFYNIPERQKFDNWFLGCTAPHIIYMHPDIYAMTNHGFDDTLQGWEQWRYSDAGSPEIRELPENWRELVPNYIGE